MPWGHELFFVDQRFDFNHPVRPQHVPYAPFELAFHAGKEVALIRMSRPAGIYKSRIDEKPAAFCDKIAVQRDVLAYLSPLIVKAYVPCASERLSAIKCKASKRGFHFNPLSIFWNGNHFGIDGNI